MSRYLTPAEKIPQLTRLKTAARSRAEVEHTLRQIGGPSTTKEYQIVISIWAKLHPPEWRECADLIDEMIRRRVQPDEYIYSAAIAACGQAKQWQRALQLFEGMEAAAVTPNEFHFSSIISACGKCGQADVAMRLFDSMREKGVTPNAVVFNSAIAACSKGDSLRARRLLSEMRERGLKPEPRSYSAAINACGAERWHEALEVGALRPDGS